MKISVNWGTSIVIAFGLFMSFILYFVFSVQGNHKYDNELVVEEYYKHDAHYSEEMEKVQNAADLPEKPIISETAEGLQIHFPKSFAPEKIKGQVSLYRPSDQKLDFSIGLKSGSTLLIPKRDFAGGLWDITLTWNYEGKDFMIKQGIYIK